jgi:hypothetical protein
MPNSFEAALADGAIESPDIAKTPTASAAVVFNLFIYCLSRLPIEFAPTLACLSGLAVLDSSKMAFTLM